MPSKIPTTDPGGGFEEDSFRHSPLEHIRSLLIAFYQGLFQASPLGAYHWSPDDNSEIYISDESPLRSSSIGQRPAISFTRGPVQIYSLGLDDMDSLNLATGSKKKTVLVPGTMTVNCSSRVSNESEFIAWICWEQLWLHRELLLQAGFFDIGMRGMVGSPSPAGSIIAADSGEEWYSTPVMLPFQFSRTSQTTPLNAVVVRDISFAIRARIRAVLAGRAVVPPPDQVGPNPSYYIGNTRPDPFVPHASDVYGNTPAPGEEPPVLPLVPHPLNPSQKVHIRSSRPNAPAVRAPSMGGRTIPISRTAVEESAEQVDPRTTSTSSFKV